MNVTERLKRGLCILLCVCMLVQNVPVASFATAEDGLCAHHTTHENCGYREAVAGADCCHEHTEACYAQVTNCVHSHGECSYVAAVPGVDCDHRHDENCGYAEAIPGADCTYIPSEASEEEHIHDGSCGYREPKQGSSCSHTHGDSCSYTEGSAEVACDHACTADSGCVTTQVSCSHSHDESCGYVEPKEASDCTYICEDCAGQKEPTCTGALDCPEEIHDEGCAKKAAEDKAAADQTAADAVAALIEALPTLKSIQAKPVEEQADDYNQVQTAYSAYENLTEDQKALLSPEETVFKPYFEYFNSIVMMTDETNSTGGTCGENLTWVLDHNGVLTISGSGDMTDRPWITYKDSIESVVVEKGVTSIGENAFYGCTSLVSIKIPDSVISIGDRAFMGCRSLRNFAVPDSITYIDNEVFRDCSGLKSIIIPEGVTSIGHAAFFECSSLRNITIPSSVTSIGNFAFSFCSSLTSVTVPDSVTGIGTLAFYCQGLTGIWVDENNSAYSNDNRGVLFNKDKTTLVEAPLEISGDYIIPDSVTNIGDDAFTGCQHLNTITFTGNAPLIHSSSFYAVSATAYYPDDNSTWTANVMQNYGGTITWLPDNVVADGTAGVDIRWVLDENGTLTISGSGDMGDRPWITYKDSIESVVVEKGVTSIYSGAFESCKNLDSVELPDSITIIDINAFSGCSSLESIVIPDSVTAIGITAFQSCKNLKSISIPASVTFISCDAFSGCDSLSGIWVSEENEKYTNDTYGVLFNKDMTRLEKYPEGLSGTYSIPNGVTTIGMDAFMSCQNLTGIIFSDTVTEISSWAFNGCNSLKNVTIPGTVMKIGIFAFAYCSGLESVTFEGNAPSINDFTFLETTAVVYYPANNATWTTDVMQQYGGDLTWICIACKDGHTEITDVGYAATCTKDGLTDGKHCSVCGEVTVKQEAIPAGHKVENGICTLCKAYGTCGDNLIWEFDKSNGKLTISGTGEMSDYDECYDNGYYHSSAPWSPYVGSIFTVEIAEGVTSIGDCAFYACKKLNNLLLPDSIEKIGKSSFARCQKLATIEWPVNLKSVGDYSFSYTGLTSVVWPQNISVIPDFVFLTCAGLSHIVIPEGVTSIGASAFSDTSLSKVEIPGSVTVIWGGAFDQCGGLKEIIFCGKAPAIGDSFDYVTATVKYPKNYPSWTQDKLQNYGDYANLTWVSYDNGSSELEQDLNQIIAQGEINNSIRWVLLANGTLTVSGTGNIPDNADYDESIYWGPFKHFIRHIVIEEGITGIGSNAFRDCCWAETVLIPDSVSEIGDNAFRYCYTLVEVTIPEKVTQLNDGVFLHCDLKKISLPQGLTSIGDSALYGCAFETITIPSSVTSIGHWAFFQCSELKEIYFLGNAPYIDETAFLYLTTTAYYPRNNSTWYEWYLGNYGGNITWKPRCMGDSHLFDQTVATAKYLKNTATCEYPAVYYKSCECGEKGTEATFAYGTTLKHIFTKEVTEVKYLKSAATCTAKAVYYKSCQCGEKGIETFEYGTTLKHNFTQEVAEAKYQKSAATCTAKAVYHKSCECGEKGTETFEYGTTLKHNFTLEVAEDKYLKRAATCTAKAVYYKSCQCGEKSATETFVFGEVLQHVFDREVVNENYRKTIATCTAQAEYYKSCVCGLKSDTESFKHGEQLSHVYDRENAVKNYLAEEAVCETAAKYFHSCSCGAKGTTTFEHGEPLGHTYNKEVAEEKYLKDAATCTSQVVYYKSCECGEKGTETFEYGDLLTHTFEKEVAEEKYLKDAATCTSKAVYYKSCECGEKGTETFEYGDPLDHTYDQEIVEEQFLKDAATAITSAVYYKSCICGATGEETFMHGDPLVEDNVLIPGAELGNTASAYIDGVWYAVNKHGDTCYIDLPEGAKVSSMVTYGYHAGDPNDVHTQYPVSMKVWALKKQENGSYAAERVEELDNILQYSGSSIRITGNKGIRMITSVDLNKKSALTGGGLADYKLVEYGTVLAKSSELSGGKPLTLGQPYARSNYAYKRGVSDPVFAYSGNLVQYTNVLVGFTMDQCKEDIAMRSYMILEDAEGKQMTIYGGTVYRSIGYIAYQNRSVFNPGSAAYNYVWEIIHHVYGSKYDAEYKG